MEEAAISSFLIAAAIFAGTVGSAAGIKRKKEVEITPEKITLIALHAASFLFILGGVFFGVLAIILGKDL